MSATTATLTGHDTTIAKYKEFVTTSFVAAIEPVVVERAEGTRVWDADGTEYLDCFAGIAVVNAGHRHPRVLAAVREQLDKVVHAATYVYHVPVVAEAAERIAAIAPGRLSKTFFGFEFGQRGRAAGAEARRAGHTGGLWTPPRCSRWRASAPDFTVTSSVCAGTRSLRCSTPS